MATPTVAAPVIPPGIYRIIVADSVEPAWLTNGEDYVTIDSPGARPAPEQEWRILHGKNHGDIFIETPSQNTPPSYLTYNGAPQAPKEGERVELRVSGFPGPLTEWKYSLGPEFRYSLHVAGSKLGIKTGRLTIHPPHLVLGDEHQLHWRFEFVRPE